MTDEQVNRENYTELGNTNRLLARYGHKIKHVPQWGWMVWSGKRWEMDDTGLIMEFAKDTIRSMYEEALQIKEDYQRQELTKHALSSESIRQLKAMVEGAKTDRSIVARTVDFDKDLYLFNVENGTIDLRTGELKAHDPKDLISKLAPVEYDPSATSDIWEKFLLDIMKGSTDLVGYLQRVVGYSLTGDTSEHAFFIAHGLGRNGKSTFFEAIARILGEYMRNTPVRTIMKKDGSSLSNDLAALNGARIVTAFESDGGQKLDLGIVKTLTGGDIVTARFLNKEFFDFKPQLKLFLATNHKPNIEENTVAAWERIKYIPFTEQFTKENGKEPDKELPNKLKSAAPAILAWAVQGCIEWQKNRLQEPIEVKEATQEYREEQDLLGEFLAERCEQAEELKTKGRDLFSAYESWCFTANVPKKEHMSSTEFGTKIKERGIPCKKTGGIMLYRGIGLKSSKDNITPIKENMHTETVDLGENGTHFF